MPHAIGAARYLFVSENGLDSMNVLPPTQIFALGWCLALTVNTPAGADDEVLDVGTAFPDGDGVQEPPTGGPSS